MLSARTSSGREQTVIGAALTVGGLIVAWELAKLVAGGELNQVAYAFLPAVVCAIASIIVRSWRSGFYFFLVWVVFEDLARKYLGNNMAIYFGKDALVLLIYISLYLSVRRKADRSFRPSFLLPITLFFWWAFIETFNPYSPSPLYGALGLKVDFFYVSLMFVGYALLRTDEDLRRFLVASMSLAAVVSALGVVQAIIGPQFLNPATLAPEIRDLAALSKVTPLTHEIINLPASVFVSNGRYSQFMLLALILGLGASGYLLLYSLRGRWIVWSALGVVAVGVVFSGSRGTLIMSVTSAIVMSAAFIWGAPWKTRQVYRMLKSIRRSAVAVGICIALASVVYPTAIGHKWDYYTETLTPGSESFQLSDRVWDYPVHNLQLAFSEPHWGTGIGTGTTSLGAQYVAKYLNQRVPGFGVESGYGNLVVEFGIIGLGLWLLWTTALVISCWRVVLKVRQSRMFPFAFTVFWFALLLLFPETFGSMNSYQDYVLNAYLWLLVGMLFRLPDLITTRPVSVPGVNDRLIDLPSL